MIGTVLLYIILWPFWLVLVMPCMMAYACGRAAAEGNNLSCLCFIIFGIVGFIIGLILNICFIPLAIIVTLILVIVKII